MTRWLNWAKTRPRSGVMRARNRRSGFRQTKASSTRIMWRLKNQRRWWFLMSCSRVQHTRKESLCQLIRFSEFLRLRTQFVSLIPQPGKLIIPRTKDPSETHALHRQLYEWLIKTAGSPLIASPAQIWPIMRTIVSMSSVRWRGSQRSRLQSNHW